MQSILPFVKVILLFTLTGLSLFRMAPRAIQEIHSWTDRILLSLLTGIAFYTIFFLLAQGLTGLPLTAFTVWAVCAAVIIAGVVVEIYRRKKHRAVSFEQSTASPPKRNLMRDVGILCLLGMIFYFSLNIRLQNQLKYPDKLLDADPYRHHIRTEALIESGYLSKHDPYIIGEVPIFELQGCYILAGVLGVAGPFSAHQLWLWGSQVFGALSVISLYLFTKLAFRNVLEGDIGPPPRPRKKEPPPPGLAVDTVATFLGLMAACLLSASPVHILRTNAGFSEAYAIPLLAPTLLFYLWAAQSRVWGDFVWFGIFFSALAFINPVPAVFIVPFFLVYAVYVLIKTRDKRWLWGNILAGGIFFLALMVWNWKFLATPLFTGASATSQAGTSGILKAMGETHTVFAKLKAGWGTFTKEIYRNLGFFNLNGELSKTLFGFFGAVGDKSKRAYDLFCLAAASAGSVWILRDPVEKRWRFNETTGFFFLSYAVFFFVLFLIPFGFISFTSKYYRYLLPISLSLSFMFPYFFWRVMLKFIHKPGNQMAALSIMTVLALVVGAEGKTWGGWVLNCTPEEYAAADWINKNTRPTDIIIANWYTGDYVRSLTKRRIIISDYPRVEVRVAKEKFNLNIPILPRDPQKVVQYVQGNPGTYYLMTSKWGPWGRYERDRHFTLLETFGKKPRTQSKIFKIESEVPEEPPAPAKANL
jgi:hypothetical protein